MYVESICIKNGRVLNMRYHNRRCHKTRTDIYQATNFINLRKHIDPPTSAGLIKCRITYTETIQKVQYQEYFTPNIASLKAVHSENIEYQYKSTDRQELQQLYQQRSSADDILIVRDGLLTDTYFANIALYKKGNWYTPKTPLLDGTCRARLLEKGRIIARDIKVEDILDYKYITVFNAMIPILDIKLSTLDICV